MILKLKKGLNRNTTRIILVNLLQITNIIWLQSIIEKLLDKHNVQPKEVKEVLINNPRFRFVEKGNEIGNDVYAALGKTAQNRRLIVFFVYKRKEALLSSQLEK